MWSSSWRIVGARVRLKVGSNPIDYTVTKCLSEVYTYLEGAEVVQLNLARLIF